MAQTVRGDIRRLVIDDPATCEFDVDRDGVFAGIGRLPSRSKPELSAAAGELSAENSISPRAADFSAPGLFAVGNKSGKPVADDHDLLSDETS